MIDKELYIIRHGQTDHNALGIVQGKGVNLPLNERGRAQAQAFFNAYKHIAFDQLYSSSLLRAQQTIEPFRTLEIPHESFSDLDEISWGDMEGAINTNENDPRFIDLITRWRNGEVDFKTSESGESPIELQARQKRFVTHLLATPHKRILIATHGRFIRAFMCTLLDLPLQQMEEFTHVNLCLYKLNLRNGKFELELRNEQGHVAGM